MAAAIRREIPRNEASPEALLLDSEARMLFPRGGPRGQVGKSRCGERGRRLRPSARRASRSRPAVDSLEPRTLLTAVQASMQVAYLSGQTANFIAGSSNVAVFYGPTVDQTPDYNYSDGDWSSGTLTLGNFGTAQFFTSADAQYREYSLSVYKADGGPNLSGLSATIFGTNGYMQAQPPIVVALPDPGTAEFPTPFAAPTHPNDGHSSLDPSALLDFYTNQVLPAYKNLNAALVAADSDQQDNVTDRVEIEKEIVKTSAVSLAIESAVAFAEGLSSPVGAVAVFCSYLEPIIRGYHLSDLAIDLGKLLSVAFRDPLNLAAQAVVSANEVVKTVQGVADDLAAKTFLPTKIEITGTSDDTGTSAVVIGGAGEHYHNDFQAVNGNYAETIGTSVFRNFFLQTLTAGSIYTRNYYGAFGDLVSADSTIATPAGLIHRHAEFIGTGIPTYDGDGNVVSTTFPSRYEFSVEPSSSGSLAQGLDSFQVSGNVESAIAPDGSDAALITEDSPSSLATVVTVPDASLPLLAMNLRWTHELDPGEDATFTVTFTDANRVTTTLYQIKANDAALHGDQLTQIIVNLPTALRGERGALQFMLTPSEDDGVKSQIILGGFTLAGVATLTPPPTPSLYAISPLYSTDEGGGTGVLEKIDAATGVVSSVITLQLPDEFIAGSVGLAADPINGKLYTILDLPYFVHDLASINVATGIVEDLGPLPDFSFSEPFQSFIGLAFDASGTLYVLDNYGTLFTVSIQDGSSSTILPARATPDGSSGANTAGLAFDPDSGLLYHYGEDTSYGLVFEAIDLSQHTVRSIPLTGDLPRISGPLVYVPSQAAFETVGLDSTYHSFLYEISPEGVVQKLGSSDASFVGLTSVRTPAPQSLYSLAVSDGDIQLRTLDRGTGATVSSKVLTGANGSLDEPIALANDPITRTIYAVLGSSVTGEEDLGTIDPATGAFTEVNTLSFPVSDIAFDSSGTLYALSVEGQELVSLDPKTGSPLGVVSYFSSGADGKMTYDPDDGRFYYYAVDSFGNTGPFLEAIDPSRPGETSYIFLSGDIPASAGPIAYVASLGGFVVSGDSASGTKGLYEISPLGVVKKIGTEDHAPVGFTLGDEVQTNVSSPTAVPGGPYAAVDGVALFLDGGHSTSDDTSDPSLTYEWDLNYDGTTFHADVVGAHPYRTFGDSPASRTIALRVTDIDGRSDIATTTLTVTAAPPIVSVGPDATLTAGDTLERAGIFTDGEVHAWTATVDYGDGSGPRALTLAAGRGFSLVHRYAAAGHFDVTVKIADGVGGTGVASFGVTVLAAPPTVQGRVVNDGGSQRSMVTSLTYTFSTAVTLDPGAIEVARSDGTDVGLVLSTSLVGGVTKVVVTFVGADIIGGSLSDGVFTITVHAGKVHETSSGRVAMTADRVDRVFRMFGDLDGDGDVDNLDYFFMRAAAGRHAGDPGYIAALDFDGNGLIDLATDVAQFNRRRGKTLKI